MGTLIYIVRLRSLNERERLVAELDKRVGKTEKYSTVHLFNEKYRLDVEIDLLVQIEKKKTLDTKLYDGFYYGFRVEVPVRLESLEGLFEVKASRLANLLLYFDNELAGYALLIGYRKDVFSPLGYALQRLTGITLRSVKLRIDDPKVMQDLASQYGPIRWLAVSNIRDTEVQSALFYGYRLEDSEIVADIAQRGSITAIKIYNERDKLQLILGKRGVIYTPQTHITAPQVAETLAPIIKHLDKLGVLKEGKSLADFR